METIRLFEAACEKLEQTASRKAKESILVETLKNDKVAELFRLALDGYEMFYVVLPETDLPIEAAISYEKVIKTCADLSARRIVGKDARALAEAVFSTKWLRRLLNKNLRCGVAAKTINKNRPGFVKEFQLMLCDVINLEEGQTFTDLRFDLQGDWRIQKKYDGLRCVCVLSGGVAQFYSRTGKPLSNMQKIEAELISAVEQDIVLDGELLAGEGAGDFELTTSIARSDVSELSEETINKLRYCIFDVIPINEWTSKNFSMPFSKRHILLHTLFPRPEELRFIRVAETEVVNFSSELQPLKHIEQGYEGSILRDGSAPYELKRSKHTLKYKQFHDCELRIIGFEEGTGKNAGRLGALKLTGYLRDASTEGSSFRLGEKNVTIDPQHGEELLKVDVGSGFSDEQRKDLWFRREQLLNALVTVKFQQICKPEGETLYSLRFPVFRRLFKS